MNQINAEKLSTKEIEEIIGQYQENIDYLRSIINKRKEEQEKTEAEKNRIKQEEKWAMLKRNAENNFGNINLLANELSAYFYQLTHNNDDKSLEEKLHDKLVAISIEYDILYEKDKRYEATKDRMNELDKQYEKISYMYGSLLGLDDDVIINRGRPHGLWGENTFYYKFSKVLNTGQDIETVYSNYYKESKNPKCNIGAIRDENDKIIFPHFIEEMNKTGISDEGRNHLLKRGNETIKNCYPGVPGKIDTLYYMVLNPYYNEIGLSPEKDYEDFPEEARFNAGDLEEYQSGDLYLINNQEFQAYIELVNEYKNTIANTSTMAK